MEENELMKKYIIIFMLLVLCAGCSSSNKVNFDEYESIKYVEKIIDVIDQYQIGDLSYNEADEKLDVLSSSIDAVKEDDTSTLLNNCKNHKNYNSYKWYLERKFDSFSLSISLSLSSASWGMLKNDGAAVKEAKEEIIELLDNLKEDIKNCK